MFAMGRLRVGAPVGVMSYKMRYEPEGCRTGRRMWTDRFVISLTESHGAAVILNL